MIDVLFVTETSHMRRVEFLTQIMVTAISGGLGPWARLREQHALLPGGEVGPADAYLVLDAVDGNTYRVSLDDLDAALAAVHIGGVPYWDDHCDARMIVRDAQRTDDATDIDAELADALIQVALFGEPTYAYNAGRPWLDVYWWRFRSLGPGLDLPAADNNVSASGPSAHGGVSRAVHHA